MVRTLSTLHRELQKLHPKARTVIWVEGNPMPLVHPGDTVVIIDGDYAKL